MRTWLRSIRMVAVALLVCVSGPNLALAYSVTCVKLYDNPITGLWHEECSGCGESVCCRTVWQGDEMIAKECWKKQIE